MGNPDILGLSVKITLERFFDIESNFENLRSLSSTEDDRAMAEAGAGVVCCKVLQADV